MFFETFDVQFDQLKFSISHLPIIQIMKRISPGHLLVLLTTLSLFGAVFIVHFPSSDTFHSLPPEKEEFLKLYGQDYGFNNTIDLLRKLEYPQLNEGAYLDYAGAARAAVLTHFNADPDHWTVIFTSGTTAGLRLLGEGLPWTSSSTLLYTIDNHVSVLGLRAHVKEVGGTFEGLHFDEVLSRVDEINSDLSKKGSVDVMNVFAFPAQSNFAGNRYPLDIISKIYDNCDNHGVARWKIVLDAASMVSCCCFDLNNHDFADFIPISFYKMFGYPTGLGALIAKKSSIGDVNPKYFGGGAVAAVLPNQDWEVRRSQDHSRLEFGTISFTDIISLTEGFNFMKNLGMANIAGHTMSLANYLADTLGEMKHSNGREMFHLYGNFKYSKQTMPGSTGQGPIVSFSMCDANGKFIPHSEVLSKCSNNGVSIRAGCVCNHGSCFYLANVTNSDVYERFKTGCECESGCCATVKPLPGYSLVETDHQSELIDDSNSECWPASYPGGQPSGVLRASIGFPTTFDDLMALVSVLRKYKDLVQ
ncbi:hypothetical protein GEMRC1_007275 [Eukaryota sp. GEM-RC1]